jgi:energy-coupling factor transporter ATP-binding protein EcfA2
MLRNITIEYIKGIQNKSFALNISPNKPSLLVAPNGFGKSSLATAFNSMNRNRIVLNSDDFYSENPAHLPRIAIEYEKPDGSVVTLEATSSTNTISAEFDCFVVNNPVKPKGIGSQFGTASATLEIKDVVLVDRIPTNVQFGYSLTNSRARFGTSSRVLPNANAVFGNLKLVEKLCDHFQDLQRANGQTIQNRINSIIGEINAQQGTTDVILTWIETNRLIDLKQIQYLNAIGDIIHGFDIGYNSETKSYLVAIQLIWLYNNNSATFKDACTFSNYKLDKQRFDATLATFNSTWKNIRSSETGRQLVVKFPKAIHISNGQRDILSFISMLFRAQRSLRKPANILIIDEVFDYLDDANLIAAQYYITTFIREYGEEGKRIYPLILTHLNPSYFKNFAFSKQKVYYLNKSTIQVNPHLITLLRNREDATIKNDVDKYLLHYDPGTINKRAEFRALNIPELWGEQRNFVTAMNAEIVKYITNQVYDPFAVCAALRVKIEEIAYKKLTGAAAQAGFLTTHKTRNKLEKAEELGVVSPESHYLLGIIYNEGMHWKENCDNVTPIASKLENLTIKKLISDAFV